MSPHKPSCEVCRGQYEIADVGPVFDLCQGHREEYGKLAAEKALREIIPAGFHHAHPRDLPEALRGWNATAGTGLYIYGKVGAGKSHTAAAIMKRGYMQQMKAGQHPTCAWVNLPVAIMDTLAAISAKRDASMLWTQAQNSSLLVLDDIGVEQPKEWVRARLYALIETRLHGRLPTIVTSNLDLGSLAERLDSPQIASRLSQMCAQVSFENSNDRRLSLAPSITPSTEG